MAKKSHERSDNVFIPKHLGAPAKIAALCRMLEKENPTGQKVYAYGAIMVAVDEAVRRRKDKAEGGAG